MPVSWLNPDCLQGYNWSEMSDAVKCIPLDRRVLVVREQRIDLRPERGAVLFPLTGLAIAWTLFGIVVLFANSLPAGLLLPILIPGLLLRRFPGRDSSIR